MSEKQWREILLEELRTVRVVCLNEICVAIPNGMENRVCGAIVEIPIEKLAGVKNCPICGGELRSAPDSVDDAFRQLSPFIGKLRQLSKAKISFVLPS